MTQKQKHIEKYDFEAFKKEQKPFTMIRTDVIQSIPMKFAQAYLLWSYLESLPETWKPNKTHLTKHFDISDRTYERHMCWLNAVGLIEYRQNRLPDGSFGKGTLTVLDGSRFNPHATFNRTDKFVSPEKPPQTPPQTDQEEINTNCTRQPKRQITAVRLNGGHIKATKIIRKETKNKYGENRTCSKIELKPIEYQETYYQTPKEVTDAKESEEMVQEMLSINPFNISELLIRTWMASQLKKRKPITSGIWALMLQDLYKYQESGLNPVEAFETMVKNNWDSLNLKLSLAYSQNKKGGDKNSKGYINSGFLNRGGLCKK